MPVLVLCRLQETLEPEGYAVISAASGIEALEKASSERPDLIIYDGGLPDLTHDELMKRLGGTGGTAWPLGLVLTMRGDLAR